MYLTKKWRMDQYPERNLKIIGPAALSRSKINIAASASPTHNPTQLISLTKAKLTSSPMVFSLKRTPATFMANVAITKTMTACLAVSIPKTIQKPTQLVVHV